MNNQKGITLIEVLAATVILTLVVVMFLNISSFSLVANKNDDDRITAIRLAEQTLNEYRRQLEKKVPIMNNVISNQNWSAHEVTPEPVAPYRIYVQQNELSEEIYNTTVFANKKHVSLQSIVLFEDRGNQSHAANFKLVPRKLTVTVYWGE